MLESTSNACHDRTLVFCQPVVQPRWDLRSMRIANSQMTQLFVLLVLFFGTSLVHAHDDVPVLLKGATIHAMDGSEPFIGSVLIEEGKIKSVGEKVDAPENATTIDLAGFHLTPGLIDSRSKLWLTDDSRNQGSSKADAKIEYGIDAWSQDWKEVASQGITSVSVQPDSSGSMGGFGAVLRVGPFDSPEAIVLKAETGLQVAIGISGNSQARFAQIAALEKQLEAAKKEIDKEKEADKPPTPRKDDPKDKKETPKADDKKEDEANKKSDPAKDALKRVLKNEIAMHVEVHHADALRGVMKLVDKYKFRVILDGLSNVDSAAELLSSSDRPMVVGPFFDLGSVPAYRTDGSRNWFADEVAKPGKLWAISGFANASGIESRWLRCHAAMAVQHGAAPRSVLAAMTINPARMLGVADMVGSIEPGKHANVAVFAGDPLSPGSAVRMVMCEGKITFENQSIKATVAHSSSMESDADSPQILPANLPSNYAIKSSQILRSDGQLKSGFVVVKDGKSKVSDSEPKTDVIFNVGDQVITPGFVNAWTTLDQNDSIWDSVDSDSSHLRAIDGVDPSTKVGDEFLNAGFIHMLIAPSINNTSSGIAGHLRLGSTDYVANPTLAGQLVFTASARNVERYPSSLSTQVSLLEDIFSGQPSETNFFLTTVVAEAIARDKKDNIESLKNGSRKTILLATENAEIESALAMAKNQKLSGAIALGKDLSEFVKAIKKQKLGVIVSPISPNAFNEAIFQYVLLDQAGVPLAIGGKTPESIRLTASMLASAGVSETSLLKALTSSGGSVIGMKDVGLEGNRGDFVIWDGNPLNLASKPVYVIVDGNHVSKK